MKSIWKKLSERKPKYLENVIILTSRYKLERAIYSPMDGRSFRRHKSWSYISNYKGWCYEHELVELSLRNSKL